jgi:hypothetical protein
VSTSKQPIVEVLYFDGCPNHEAARVLVERVVADLGISADVRLVDVPDAESATRERFLGSPTIRVNGDDVEPGVEQRQEFVLSCRVYRTDEGFAGQPPEALLRQALTKAGQ